VTSLVGAGDPLKRLEELLNRIYAEFRNMGLTSEERALNFAVTDAMQLQGIIQIIASDPSLKEFQFDSLEVVRSPICRPDSDCWDVKLYFFDPTSLLHSRRVYRFTVDVSDLVPVMIGDRKEWATC